MPTIKGALGPGFQIVLFYLLLSNASHANDFSYLRERDTNGNIWEVRLATASPPLNQIHSWYISAFSSEGRPLTGLTLSISGGMRAHGHGLPTAPKVSAETSPGIYQVDGFKFQMWGEWQVLSELTDQHGNTVGSHEFEFVLAP
ncbi:FixH family protein [Aliagarivorans marinus]|uniref:FixH family protein n=1 Tax=Aliagarivorans marinus TaxID=561965 RepID=UPI000683EA78|nr:FixH family protein [Aliagarivorans marinus]